jgi:hypothetical protein
LIPVTLVGKDKTVETNALIDSGADGTFIDKDFAKERNVTEIPLPKPIKVFNVDGTPNKVGRITHYTWVTVQIGKRQESIKMMHTIQLPIPYSNGPTNW